MRLISTRTGLIISSDLAFSLPVATASGRVYSRIVARVLLGWMEAISGKNLIPSTVVKLKASLTLVMVVN